MGPSMLPELANGPTIGPAITPTAMAVMCSGVLGVPAIWL